MNLKKFKKEFDPLLLSFIDGKIRYFQKYKHKELTQNLKHLRKLAQNGKRLRPYLAFITYKAYGGKKDKETLNLLVFIEIFHIFCLVHDDIIDNADFRHGTKTIHKFADNVQSKNSSPNFGKSIAILLGDYLLAWSFEILLTNNNFENKQTEKIFLEMIDEVITGQFIDANLSSKNSSSDNEINQKMYLKTASYSIIRPMMIGASLAKNNLDENFMFEFGKYLGTAFQVQDDLFDIIYDKKQVHKSTFIDMEQNQHTLFTNYVLKNGTGEQKKVIKTQMGQKVREQDRKKLRDIFIKSGAIEYGQSIINNNTKNAKSTLATKKFRKEDEKNFNELIEIINQRKS